jgi:hypothetical protein
MEQIKRFNPPPNPAKITDSRAKGYIAKYGAISWEVDALNPDTLHKLLRDEINELIDVDKFKLKIDQEEQDKERLRKMVGGV